MYLHKSEWGGLYGIFGIEQSFLSCPWCVQLFLTRTRYKFLINFVLANPNYLYPQFSNSFPLMTGKEMELDNDVQLTSKRRRFLAIF